MNEIILAAKYISSGLHADVGLRNMFKWIANVCIFISAIGVSVSVEVAEMSVTFLGFFVAHIIWAWMAIIMKDKPLVYLNLFFLPLDIWAMVIRLN